MRLFSLVLLFAVLSLLDAGTTIYLYENFPSGRELNPYVYPGSWAGLLLAPVKFLIYALFLFCVIFSERNEKIISGTDGLLSDAAMVAYFPLFLIFTKVLAVLNNLMPMIGISTPISYVLMFMKNFPGDESIHYPMFWSALFLMMAPPGLWAVRRIYRVAPAIPGSYSEA